MLIEFSRHLFMHSSPKVPSQQLYNTLVYRRVHGQLNDCKVLRPCGWKKKALPPPCLIVDMRCLRWYGVLSSTWLLYTYYSMPVETEFSVCDGLRSVKTYFFQTWLWEEWCSSLTHVPCKTQKYENVCDMNQNVSFFPSSNWHPGFWAFAGSLHWHHEEKHLPVRRPAGGAVWLQWWFETIVHI